MSENYGSGLASNSEGPARDDQGKVDAAKHEAGALKDTASEQVSNVADTAKAEVGNVAREANSQVKDLFAQTQSELKEQAGAQQQRVASGLRSLGDELGSMARNSETSGLASDLVWQVSDRARSAASWLDSRDPGSLLAEVKSYARRKPGTFIAVAAIAGVAAGRLTRALAGNATDEKEEAEATSALTAPVDVVDTSANAADGGFDNTPLYDEQASTLGEGYQSTLGVGDQR